MALCGFEVCPITSRENWILAKWWADTVTPAAATGSLVPGVTSASGLPTGSSATMSVFWFHRKLRGETTWLQCVGNGGTSSLQTQRALYIFGSGWLIWDAVCSTWHLLDCARFKLDPTPPVRTQRLRVQKDVSKQKKYQNRFFGTWKFSILMTTDTIWRALLMVFPVTQIAGLGGHCSQNQWVTLNTARI